jgi:D-Tyr-tRNAtyr deacylase
METSNFAGVFSLDTTSRNAESLDVLKGLFDAMIEVKDSNDGPKMRVRGDDFGPRSWTAF